MPLYELEEGTSRKFYRIELHGTDVHLHWGRIGGKGEKQILPHDNETAARVEYHRQIDKRLERGYRLVVDEAVPHDPAAAEQAQLAKTGALSSSPRFLFSHATKKKFAWVEARGRELVHAEGPIGQEARTAPKTEPCANADAAVRARDAMIGKLVSRGFDLELFGVKEPPKKPPKLVTNAELERAVADDSTAWSVLEDWLLEQNDPRGELIKLVHDAQPTEELRRRNELLPMLLGGKHESLHHVMTDVKWRAGYILSCRYGEPARSGGPLSEAFYAAPATHLLDFLGLYLPRLARLPAHLALIAEAPCAHSLRELVVERVEGGKHVPFDMARLAALSNLQSLSIRSPLSCPRGSATLPIRELTLTVGSRDAVTAWLAQTFPALRSFTFFVEGPFVDELAPLFDGKTAPALEQLHVRSPASESIFERYADTPFAKRLAKLTS